MEAGSPSRTAMGSGLLRAAHMEEDPPPWVFEETVARRLLTTSEVMELEHSMAGWSPEVRQSFRLAHAVRSRLAEDVAVQGLATGRRHYVVLGAGLDTFAWRHPKAGEFTITEIDHPQTQAWKRAALRRCGLFEPRNVRFVPADLSSMDLEELALPDHATWNWLGVTMYLPRGTTEGVLRTIARRRQGTTLVVNFLLDADTLDDLGRVVRATSTSTVAAVHEPIVGSYSKAEVAQVIGDAGFADVELFDSDALTTRYLGGSAPRRLSNSTIIAVARI